MTGFASEESVAAVLACWLAQLLVRIWLSARCAQKKTKTHTHTLSQVGEPMEVAVARETREESGVTVDLGSVTYCASQPWPFPRSLMVGFYAVAAAQQKSNGPAADSNGPCVESNGPGVAASGETNGSEQQRQQAPAWAPRPGARGYDLLPHDGRRAAIDVQVLQQEVEEVGG